MQEQVEEMLADHIIEESYSSYVIPSPWFSEKEKASGRLDARDANMFMTPDRAKVPPMQMLLQRFHGASYISTLDLSSDFFADSFGKNLKIMDSFPVPEQGVPIYTRIIWFSEFSQCFYLGTSIGTGCLCK